LTDSSDADSLHTHTLDNLTDTNLTSPVNKSNLSYDTPSGKWIDRTPEAETIQMEVKLSEDVTAGDWLYITGIDSGTITVGLADSSNAAKMPAVGASQDTDTTGNTITMTTFGKLNSTDTSSWGAGDELYISSTPGEATNVKPTGTNLIQKVACVIDVGVSGNIFVFGAGRSNDIPNLPEGEVWIGNGSGVATARDLTDDDIDFQVIGTPTYTTQQDINNLILSAGLLTDGAIITDAGSGNVNLASKEALFRISDSEAAALKSATIPSQSSQSIPTDTVRYIVAEYNGGTPQYSIETTNTANGNTIFPIGSVVNEGDTLHLLNNPMKSFDGIRAVRHRLLEAESPERANSLGGLIIGETGTRNITLSAGKIYNCANVFDIDGIDTSVSGNTFASYYNTTQQAAAATQWDNDNYNNGGVLTSLTAAKYANLWWYIEMDGSLVMMYGIDEYANAAAAQAEGAPATLPSRLSTIYHALLIGRFIFQKGAATATIIEDVFSTTFQGAGAASHNDQSGLQGGTAGEYYHGTAAEYTVLQNTSGTNTGDEPAASTSTAGIQENATTAEINTASSDTLTMVPGQYKASNFGTRELAIALITSDVAVTVADGTAGIPIPASLNGHDIVDVLARVHDKGVTGTTDIQVRRRRSGADVDVLSTKITIGDEWYASDGVINTSNDDLVTGDMLYVDRDAIHSGTAPNGLSVVISTRLP
jgi:hypothetical protein